MLSETDRDSLSDIVFNIDLAISFAQGFDYQRFLADMRTFYAITRCLEIISEASRRLSPETKARHPDIPWRGCGPSPGMGHRARVFTCAASDGQNRACRQFRPAFALTPEVIWGRDMRPEALVSWRVRLTLRNITSGRTSK
jgi:hypothetical protein